MTRPPTVHKYAGDDPNATRTACGLKLAHNVWRVPMYRISVDADVRRVTCGNCARVATGKKTTP